MIFCAMNAWADGNASDIYLPYDSVELIYIIERNSLWKRRCISRF
jgi:hypothetical protein